MLTEIITIIADYTSVPKKEITAESRIIADLELQSMDIFSLVGQIEEKFGIEIEDYEIMDISTVGELGETISKKDSQSI